MTKLPKDNISLRQLTRCSDHISLILEVQIVHFLLFHPDYYPCLSILGNLLVSRTEKAQRIDLGLSI